MVYQLSILYVAALLSGAFWCENCNKQKELLGKEAMAVLGTSYVECFPNGVYQNAPVGPGGYCSPRHPSACNTRYLF